jgi:hypothetical protein
VERGGGKTNYVHFSTDLFPNLISNPTNVACKYQELTNWCDPIPANEQDQAVKDLARGGVICKVFGHRWGSKNVYGTWYDFEALDAKERKCHICGKVETKTEEWK